MIADFRLARLLEDELAADRADDDVTARLLGKAGNRPARAEIKARRNGVFSGEMLATALEEATRGAVRGRAVKREGERYQPTETVFAIEGPAGVCLSVERTVLNLLSHLCGIATATGVFVDAVAVPPVAGHRTRILATRKTLPGLREWQLGAVRAGGGWVHRRSLADGIMIKENHQACVPVADLHREARATRSPLHRIEIEVQSLEELDRALLDPPDVVMLDNLGVDGWREAMTRIRGRCEVEVSGNMTPPLARAAAELGVHYVSVGSLTHSVVAADLGLDFTD